MTTGGKTSVLIIGYVWPEPTSSAAGLRTQNLIDIFKNEGWSITFMSSAKENQYAENIRKQGIPTVCIEANDPRFDSFIAELKPTFVIFDRFMTEEQFSWRVRDNSPDSIRVLDTVDLHSLRRSRMEELEKGVPLEDIFDIRIDLERSEYTHRELASIYRSDLTLIISSLEFKLLTSRLGVPAHLLQTFGLCYPPPPVAFGFHERKGFVMIGNFRHRPNHDSIFWLKNEIWPLIRSNLPSEEIHIYGAYAPKEVMALDNPKEGFVLKGWAENQYAVLSKYRINLAPLRFGAGIKGKITDGWFTGCPVVTTPIGSEGMYTDGLTFGGVIARDAENFSKCSVALYRDSEKWVQLQSAGLAYLSKHCSPGTEFNKLIKSLNTLKNEFKFKRDKNLIGAMLWHHFQKSTTYFARWIEAKNGSKKKEQSFEPASLPLNG
jgi:O-antigen biosynthesis protein